MKTKFLIGLTLVAVPTIAIAGEYISGIGQSQAEAAANAEYRAAQRAQASRTCYRLVDYNRCSQSNGQWTCYSEVTHHTHTVNGGLCPN